MDFRLDALQQSSHIAEDDISGRMAVFQVCLLLLLLAGFLTNMRFLSFFIKKIRDCPSCIKTQTLIYKVCKGLVANVIHVVMMYSNPNGKEVK
jgi:hypothetical protein